MLVRVKRKPDRVWHHWQSCWITRRPALDWVWLEWGSQLSSWRGYGRRIDCRGALAAWGGLHHKRNCWRNGKSTACCGDRQWAPTSWKLVQTKCVWTKREKKRLEMKLTILWVLPTLACCTCVSWSSQLFWVTKQIVHYNQATLNCAVKLQVSHWVSPKRISLRWMPACFSHV